MQKCDQRNGTTKKRNTITINYLSQTQNQPQLIAPLVDDERNAQTVCTLLLHPQPVN